MSYLPLPRWNLISGTLPATTASVDVIADIKRKVIENSIYWGIVESPNTGSTSLLLKPKTSFTTGSGANVNIVIATAITGARGYQTPDTTAGNATKLQIGMTPDITEGGSGSFRLPNADRPFQTATGNPRWAGYWHFASSSFVSATFLIECEESIFIGFKDRSASSGVMGALAGCIVEALESGSGENDRRIYGMVVGGGGVAAAGAGTLPLFSTTMWTNTSNNVNFFSMDNTAGAAHAGAFIVSGGVKLPDTYFSYLSRQPSGTPSQDSFATWASGSVPGSMQIGLPISFSASAVIGGTVPLFHLGMLRGVYVSSDERGLTTVNSGGLPQVIKVGTRFNSVQDTILFGPCSGAFYI